MYPQFGWEIGLEHPKGSGWEFNVQGMSHFHSAMSASPAPHNTSFSDFSHPFTLYSLPIFWITSSVIYSGPITVEEG
jgi:hypothetical protein